MWFPLDKDRKLLFYQKTADGLELQSHNNENVDFLFYEFESHPKYEA